MKTFITAILTIISTALYGQEPEIGKWYTAPVVDEYGEKTSEAYAYFSQGTFSNSVTEKDVFIGKVQYVPNNYYGIACYFYGNVPVDFGKPNTVYLYFKKDGKEKSKKFRVNKNLIYIGIDDIKELPLPCKLLFKRNSEHNFTFLIEAPELPNF